MADYGSSHSGAGYGDGDGYGCCYGDGSGDGDGSGRGSSFGAGDGYGSGVGTGWADGYGYNIGDGSGYGLVSNDILVATLGKYEVRVVITPWGRTVRVGCQVHDLDVWRERWCAIAQEYDVTVSDEEVAQLIALIEAAPLGPEWLESEEGRRA